MIDKECASQRDHILNPYVTSTSADKGEYAV